MRTLKYVLKRLFFMVLTFFVILTITFCLVKTLQSEIPLGKEAEAELARREALGWDKPVLEQYGIYLKNFFTKETHTGVEEHTLTFTYNGRQTTKKEVLTNIKEIRVSKLEDFDSDKKTPTIDGVIDVTGPATITAADLKFTNPLYQIENPDVYIATIGEGEHFYMKGNFMKVVDSPLFDLGVSLRVAYMKPVASVIAERMPPTILVNVLSILVGLPLGIVLGIFAALKKNTWIDHVISVIIVIFISVPSFVLAFFLQYFLAFKLGWFPLVMSSKAEAGGLFTWKMIYSLMLPIMASAFYEIAYFARTVRAELTEALTSDYMLLARTKGLTQSKAVVHHALKNAMVPILPIIIGTFLNIMGGSMILERIFAIPGVGDLTLKALQGPDYDLFVGTAMFYTLIGLLGGLITDLSYGFLDPRIKMGER